METEAAACICDTPATGFGSLAGTSTAQYRVRNQVFFSMAVFEQEVVCALHASYAQAFTSKCNDLMFKCHEGYATCY